MFVVTIPVKSILTLGILSETIKVRSFGILSAHIYSGSLTTPSIFECSHVKPNSSHSMYRNIFLSRLSHDCVRLSNLSLHTYVLWQFSVVQHFYGVISLRPPQPHSKRSEGGRLDVETMKLWMLNIYYTKTKI